MLGHVDAPEEFALVGASLSHGKIMCFLAHALVALRTCSKNNQKELLALNASFDLVFRPVALKLRGQ